MDLTKWKTIVVKRATAKRLDNFRANGQSYDGIINTLLDTRESIEQQAIRATVKLNLSKTPSGE